LRIQNKTLPVRLLGGDQNFIPWAYGQAYQLPSLFANLGTGAFVQAYTTQSLPEHSPLLTSAVGIEQTTTPHCVAEGTVNSATAVFSWWTQKTGQKLIPKTLSQLPWENDLPILFCNTLAGTGSPWWRSAAEPQFIRLTNQAVNDRQKIMAILESIVFNLNANIEYLKQVNSSLQQMVVSGGLAQLDNLCQLLANLSDLTVIRFKDREASARGAAFYLEKITAYDALPETVFKPHYNQHLMERYKRYCELLGT